jgi:two-component system cell cycle sensor histidine kinase/response regulator CckA
MNLVVNSRDAMPEGGLLTLSTSNVEFVGPKIMDSRLLASGSYVVLAVSDTGEGVPREIQSKIFEPFFTTKEEKGTGLGLAMVYGIAKQSGGDVFLESEPGKGSTFRVYLPECDQPPPDLVDRDLASPQSLDATGEVILLVEDDAELRRYAQAVLSAAGYRVMDAPTGGAALELLGGMSRESPIDLLLTDIVMPGMSGKALSRKVIAEYPQVRILFMSGYSDEVAMEQGVSSPGISYLPKPFSPEVLLQKIRSVLDQE